MCHPIEITERTNDALEELQEDVRRGTGRTISKRILLERIVRTAHESNEATIELFRDDPDS